MAEQEFWSVTQPEEGVQGYDESLNDSFNPPPSSSDVRHNPQPVTKALWEDPVPQEQEVMQDATTAWQRPDAQQPETQIDHDMGLLEMAGKSFVVGLGDMVDSFGDIADFVSGSSSSEVSKQVYGVETSKPISDAFHNWADALHSYGDDVPGLKDLENITWDDLTEADFWATGVARMLPFALSLLVPATAAAKGISMATKGAKFAKASEAIAKGAKSVKVLNKYADPLMARGLIHKGLAITGAGATSNMIEGAALAGQTLNEGVRQGLTEQEASFAGRQVFVDNLASMAADIVQYGLFMGQVNIGKGVLAGAEKIGAKVAGTSVGQAAGKVAGKVGEKAAKTSLSKLKAPGIKDVIKGSFKAIGMGAAHGVTDGVVEQFQEVYQDWSVQRRIAEAKGEGESFPDYLDFFMAKEQLPTRVLSFATSLLMSGTSNVIRTATENRVALQSAIDNRNESHEMLEIFSKDLDKGVYTVKKTVRVKDEKGNIVEKEIIEELSAEQATEWGRDAAAHNMIMNAVVQDEADVIAQFFQSKADSGVITEEQHQLYKDTMQEIQEQMDKMPTQNLDNKGKTDLVSSVWLNHASKRSLANQREKLEAKIESIK